MSKLSTLDQTLYVEDFKGKAVFVVNPEAEGNRRISFGVSKARLILAQVERIKQFIETYPDGSYEEEI